MNTLKSEGYNNKNQDYIFNLMKKYKGMVEKQSIVIALLNKKIKSLIK